MSSLLYLPMAVGAAGIGAAYLRHRVEQHRQQAKTWATRGEIRKWGLISERKVDANGWPLPCFVLGENKDGLIVQWHPWGEGRHVLFTAPSGAGKTWTAFYPTLMYGWTHSCFVHVRKKAMADLTIARRAQIGEVIWFDPSSMGSAKYNPIDRVRADTIFAFQDAQNIVESLSKSVGDGGDNGNPSFIEPAKDFASAAIVYWKTHAPVSQRNYGGLRIAFSDCHKLAICMLVNTNPCEAVRNELQTSARAILNNPSERFIGSVEGIIRSWLRPYQDIVLKTVTSASDFSPEDLVTGDKPTTLYVHLPPAHDARLAPYVNLMIDQIMRALMEHEHFTRDGQKKRWQFGWIIDEAWRLGKMQALEGALADIRSYGMPVLMGMQGINQVIDHYGADNSIVNNCRWITTWQNGFDECKRVADMLGEEERVKKSKSKSGGVLSQSATSITTTKEWRPVIQAAHVNNIDKEEVIIFGEGKPIRAKRTNPKTWQKLVKELVRPDRVRGQYIAGPPEEPEHALLPYLTRALPAPKVLMLPPPGKAPPPPPPRKRPRRRL